MSDFLFNRVLLVDDSPIDNLINKKLLATKRIAEYIDFAFSVEQAIEYVNNLVNHNKELPEIIFLDIRMPIEDGFDFLTYFDKLNYTIKKKCRIMMLSSSMDPKDEEKSKQFTCVVDYICKPLSYETLEHLKNG
jgi:response regulator of citrate/malate metabolism